MTDTEEINIGSRRELFIDEYLVGKLRERAKLHFIDRKVPGSPCMP